MNKIKIITVFAVGMLISNLFLVGFIATRRPHPPGPEFENGPKCEIIRRLDFSSAQVQAYEKLIEWHRGEIDKADRNIMRLKNELYQTFNDADAQKKDSLMIEINKQQLAIENIHYKHFTDISKLCTSEQKPKFEALTHDLAEYFHPGRRQRRR